MSLIMESVMLLGHVNFSMNNKRTDRIKNSFQKDLHYLCEAGNTPKPLLLGDEPPKKTREAKESSKLSSYPCLNWYTECQNQKAGSLAKDIFVIPG